MREPIAISGRIGLRGGLDRYFAAGPRPAQVILPGGGRAWAARTQAHDVVGTEGGPAIVLESNVIITVVQLGKEASGHGERAQRGNPRRGAFIEFTHPPDVQLLQVAVTKGSRKQATGQRIGIRPPQSAIDLERARSRERAASSGTRCNHASSAPVAAAASSSAIEG